MNLSQEDRIKLWISRGCSWWGMFLRLISVKISAWHWVWTAESVYVGEILQTKCIHYSESAWHWSVFKRTLLFILSYCFQVSLSNHPLVWWPVMDNPASWWVIKHSERISQLHDCSQVNRAVQPPTVSRHLFCLLKLFKSFSNTVVYSPVTVQMSCRMIKYTPEF